MAARGLGCIDAVRLKGESQTRDRHPSSIRPDRDRAWWREPIGSSHALLMAAEGAISGYEHVVGERWKPFERALDNPGQTVDRKVAEMQMAAFG